jgi:DNA polymerase III epsilon subunit-like protein
MSHKIVGHNLKGFDLPYLIRSTMLNRAKGKLYLTPARGKFWPDLYHDTMEFEGAGEYGYRVSLDNLAQQYGFDGKNGNGKLFYTYSRDEQEAYLENDLLITRKIFEVQNNSFNICDNYTIVDIETAPKSDAEIMALAPEFKPENVKVGNLKDPAKIEEKIEAARDSHYDDIISKAALNAKYSNPVAIGYIHHDGSIEMDFGEPKKLIERFWEVSGNIWGQWQADKNLA